MTQLVPVFIATLRPWTNNPGSRLRLLGQLRRLEALLHGLQLGVRRSRSDNPSPYDCYFLRHLPLAESLLFQIALRVQTTLPPLSNASCPRCQLYPDWEAFFSEYTGKLIAGAFPVILDNCVNDCQRKCTVKHVNHALLFGLSSIAYAPTCVAPIYASAESYAAEPSLAHSALNQVICSCACVCAYVSTAL